MGNRIEGTNGSSNERPTERENTPNIVNAGSGGGSGGGGGTLYFTVNFKNDLWKAVVEEYNPDDESESPSE